MITGCWVGTGIRKLFYNWKQNQKVLELRTDTNFIHVAKRKWKKI